MNIEIYKNGDADFWPPLDSFTGGKPVEAWINEVSGQGNKYLEKRRAMYNEALELYQSIAHDELRDEPHVFETVDLESDDCFPATTLWFVFKESNNGTTFKIKAELRNNCY